MNHNPLSRLGRVAAPAIGEGGRADVRKTRGVDTRRDEPEYG